MMRAATSPAASALVVATNALTGDSVELLDGLVSYLGEVFAAQTDLGWELETHDSRSTTYQHPVFAGGVFVPVNVLNSTLRSSAASDLPAIGADRRSASKTAGRLRNNPPLAVVDGILSPSMYVLGAGDAGLHGVRARSGGHHHGERSFSAPGTQRGYRIYVHPHPGNC